MATRNHVIYVAPSPRDRVVGTLRETGLAVQSVPSHQACLDALDDGSCDCIITAYDLEDGTTGIDLCVDLAESGVPVIVYAAAGSEAIAGEALAAGAAGYVPTSQGLNTLVTRVLEVIVSHDSADEQPEKVYVAGAADVSSAGDDAGDGGYPDPSWQLPTTGPSESGALPADATPEPDANWKDLAMQQSPVAIIEWSLDLEVRHWNPAAESLFGYDEAAARGRQATELIIPADEAASFRAWWDEWLDGELTQSRGISRNVRSDGSTVRCEWFSTPLIDATGEPCGVLSIARDATTDFRRSVALEELQTATQELMQMTAIDAIADRLIETTADLIEGALAGVRVYDSRHNHLELVGVSDHLESAGTPERPIGPGDGSLWDIYESQEQVVIDDASAEMVPYELDVSVGNAVVHPLGDHGLLTVASTGETRLEEVDRNLIHILSATAEVALDRAARERELERAKMVIEAVGDSMYAADATGRFVTVNDTLVDLTGYDRGELIGAHLSRFLTDESVVRGQREIERIVSGESSTVATYEVEVVTADGEHIPCEATTTVPDREGLDQQFAGSVGIVRDVSDRKSMEAELRGRRKKTEQLHAIASRLEACETPAQVYDLTIEAAEEVLEFDVCVVEAVVGDELVPKAVSSKLGSERASKHKSVETGIAGKTVSNQRSYRIDDVKGHDEAEPTLAAYRSLLSVPIGDRAIFQAVSTDRAAFTSDDQELTELLLSHVADALERVAFEAELRAERDRFRALFENVPDPVVSTRRTSAGPVVERVNPAFEHVFGYDQSEIESKLLDSFIVPADRKDEAASINERGNDGEPVEAEVKRRTAKGLRDFMMRVVPMTIDDESAHAFGLYTDITAQKQRQKRVEILNRVLRHDLRNGMNIINGCAEMLREAVDESEADFADTIQERAEELISLAEKTRAVERTLERDEQATGPVDIVDCAQNAVSQFEGTYPDASVTCSWPESLFASGDDLLEEALYQVLENAIEHHDRSDPQIEVAIEVVDDDDEMLSVRVTDDGPGIPANEQALLEEEKEITQLRHASGLGLWLVNWVATQAGGQLRFESNEPRGTCVEMLLPRAPQPTAETVRDGTAASD